MEAKVEWASEPDLTRDLVKADCWLRDCDLAGLKGGPGICISNKHPEDSADPPGPFFEQYFVSMF